MTEDEMKTLRQLYHSLTEQQRLLDKQDRTILHYSFQVLDQELQELQKKFPDLVPQFNLQDFFTSSHGRSILYDSEGIQAHLARVLGRLKVAIEEPASSPVTERRELPFISETSLRKILERDYSEIQRAYVSQCWKSVIILCGGSIEAILLDLLLANDSKAKASSVAPKISDVRKWDLADLINVSVDLKLVSAGIDKLSHPIREYRNLVHPGNELRSELTFDAEESRIALEVLSILCRDLSK